MTIWAKVIKGHKITNQAVRDFASARPDSADGWRPVLLEFCKELDLSCPVLLKKHVQELRRFSRTAFYPADFMEGTGFDRLEIELFPEKKKASL